MRFIGFGLVTVPVLTIGAVMGDLRSDDLAPALSRHSWCADLGLDGAGGVIPMRSRSSTEDGALGAGLGFPAPFLAPPCFTVLLRTISLPSNIAFRIPSKLDRLRFSRSERVYIVLCNSFPSKAHL